MSKKVVGFMAALTAVLVASAMLVAQLGSPAVSAKVNPVRIDLVVDLAGRSARDTVKDVKGALESEGYQVDSFFDVFYVLNIGSSGEDGVSLKTGGGNFDVFFEVEYKVARIETEMIAMSLTSVSPIPANPDGAIDAVKSVLPVGTLRYGHVTLIK